MEERKIAMEFIPIIDLNEFDSFVKNSPYNHYMKTSYWAQYQKKNGYHPYFVGMKEEGQLVGTALILEKKIPLVGSYLYIPWGPCVDYTNQTHLDYFLTCLKQFALEKKAVFLRFDANVQRVSRDSMGNQIDGINQEYITEWIKEQGFVHKGYGYAYNGSWVNRYTLVIDLKPPLEEIVGRFTKSKQSILKRQPQMGVSTRIGSKKDLPYLIQFEKELSIRQQFKPHSISFFEHLIDSLKENIKIYVTEVNLDQMILGIEEELDSKKYRKDPEAKAAKEKELRLAKSWKQEHGSTLVLAAGIFVFYGKKSWDLYTYNAKDYPNFKATDNLHYFAIQDLKESGVEYYDMVGFSGVTDKSDPYYGLYDYKRSFGSEFMEFIGEFDYIRDQKKYQLYKKTLRYTKGFKRRVYKVVYRKKES